jgi:hypothetical protein
MKNGVDFIYEYSDLNLFHTRVQILTGEYSGIVLEFGSSILAQIGNKNTFTFDYILYEVPDQFYGATLRKDKEFNEFLGYLLVDVIHSRNTDSNEKQKLDEAASYEGKSYSKIKINEKWYPQNVFEQPKTNLGNF